MATSKDILNSFGKEATIVKAVALYLEVQMFVKIKRVSLLINWHCFRLNETPKVV